MHPPGRFARSRADECGVSGFRRNPDTEKDNRVHLTRLGRRSRAPLRARLRLALLPDPAVLDPRLRADLRARRPPLAPQRLGAAVTVPATATGSRARGRRPQRHAAPSPRSPSASRRVTSTRRSTAHASRCSARAPRSRRYRRRSNARLSGRETPIRVSRPDPCPGAGRSLRPAIASIDARRPRRSAAVRASLAVGLAVSAYGVSFGALAVASGLEVWQACVLSLFMFSGGSQFALIGVLASGGVSAGPAAITAAALLGVRNGLYSMRMAPIIGGPWWRKLLAGQWTIDETTAVSTAQPTLRGQRVGFWVTGAIIYVGLEPHHAHRRPARRPRRRRADVRTGCCSGRRLPRLALAAPQVPPADRRRHRCSRGRGRPHPVAATRTPGAGRRGRRRRGRRHQLARAEAGHPVRASGSDA